MNLLNQIKSGIAEAYNKMVAYERRIRARCPHCKSSAKFIKQDFDKFSRYLHCCETCKLRFRYIYLHWNTDDLRRLQIHALCPECNTQHWPEIVGPIDTNRVPCETCWARTKPRQTQTADEEETRKLYLPAVFGEA